MTSGESMPEKRDCGMDAAAYVLGALEGDELEAFRAHMAACVVCRDEVGAFQEVVDTLPLLAPPQPVPRGLKRRVMAEVRAAPRQRSRAKVRKLPFRLPRGVHGASEPGASRERARARCGRGAPVAIALSSLRRVEQPRLQRERGRARLGQAESQRWAGRASGARDAARRPAMTSTRSG